MKKNAIILAAALALTSASAIAQFVAPDVTRVGTLTHFAIRESSGLAASRRYPGVIWTHNDSGKPFVFAIREDGTWIRGFEIRGANLIDWEDIAIDHLGNLYLADIGIDGLQRTHVAVHRVREPNPYVVSGARVDRTWYLRIPGPRLDAEAFFVWNGFGYIVTKQRINDAVSIHCYPLSASGSSIPMRKVADVSVTAPVTAADISFDGGQLALLTEEGAYAITINGTVSQAGLAPRIFTPLFNSFMEGCAFVGDGLLVSSETRQMLLFTHEAFRVK